MLVLTCSDSIDKPVSSRNSLMAVSRIVSHGLGCHLGSHR